MKFRELITERASAVLYHYTSTYHALKILNTGEFALASITGNKSEEQYAPKGHPYFLSLTRTSLGDYHNYVGTGAVLFALDGNWFNSRYVVKPIDYWERSWIHTPGRTREAEDRVFSKEPTIPTTPITAVHVLLKEQSEYHSPRTRQLLIAAKQQGLQTYLYTDEKAWRLLDKRRAVAPGAAKPVLKGHPVPNGPSRKATDYVKPWIELIEKNKEEHLSDRAKRALKTLMYYHRANDGDGNMGVDLSNARKPDSGDRESAIKLIQYMQKNGYGSDTHKLYNDLYAKWDAIKYPKEK